ncbi:response regulator transcription factor [Bacteroides pyogenes]|uniref:response regulator transcription factor n=1 Tax=Bacteroides pyogenes TaxID=310300 RepID=UPI001BAC5601|nr:response regulator transcription factor [Bacteroides pyogenes]MBR8706440.1 Transcriptional regulatory protein LnrK [Bacteroides pyogenes]
MKLEIKVAVYEDNDALRESLSFLIKGSGLLRFAGAYPDCRAILQNCQVEMPDVILMDIDMPYINGIEATRLVKDKFPDINVMMLTVMEDRDKIFDALRAGATGYLLKKASAIEIIESVTELANGGSPMSGEIARKVLEFFTAPNSKIENNYALSVRELEVLKRLVTGDSYKMIADHCCISIGTVCGHINSIYRKLAVNSKSEAVVKAIKERLV